MKTSLLSALLSFAAASSSMGAVTVSITGNPSTGPAFFDPVNIVLDGSLVRIGTFVSPPAEMSFAQLGSLFHEFARTTMGNFNNTNTGHIVRNNIQGGGAPDSPDPDAFFIGKPIYIWVYDSPIADPIVAQGVFGTATVYADGPVAVSAQTISFVNVYGGAPFLNPPSVLLNASDQVTRFNLASGYIPEPGTAVLTGITIMAGLLRHRSANRTTASVKSPPPVTPS